MPERLVRQLSDAESELLADVLHAYGLTGPASDLVRIAVWGDRFVAAFSVTEGRFFLKEWSSFHETEDEIAFCLDIQETARRGGVPAPRIYRTTSGERTYTSGDRRFALNQFLGEAYDPAHADAQLSSCTQALGLLHRATTGATIGGKRWRDDPFYLSLSTLARVESDLSRAPLDPGERRRRLEALHRLRQLTDSARREMESLGWWDLPVQPIHGDYCQFNCRFRSSDVVAVIDWDHARLAPRLLDVAHALNITLGWPSSIDYYEDFRWSDAMPLEPADVSAWLAKYCRSGAPLDGREVQILPWACLALWPWQTAGFCLQNAGTANGAAAVVDYAEQIETASTLFVEAALAHAE